jgi:starch phosphorylase
MNVDRYAARILPPELQGLTELAFDMRWSWNHGGDAMWRAVDPELWEFSHDPWLMIETVSTRRLEELAKDKTFLAELTRQLEERERRMRESTWFDRSHGRDALGTVAYFSMEFGLSEALPIYSGGLGVLAGDHMKTASDLGVPIIGVGLLYQRGYFRQALDHNGEQVACYPYNAPSMLPVRPLRDARGDWTRVELRFPGRMLYVRAWEVMVGRVRLWLLDTNDPLNHPADRGITGELYGAEPEIRFQQEIILGVGGWRLVEQMGVDARVCHLNEGHAAFAILERARQFMLRSGQPFKVALRCTRAGNVFTTHTPVAAAFDVFAPEMFGEYANRFAAAVGVGVEELLALGRANPRDPREPFNMAYLAARGAASINAVSRLHGEVSRRIFRPLFPRLPLAEVPISHVTNGVHMPSWDSQFADELWTESCGKGRWLGELEEIESNLGCISDEVLWSARSHARQALIEYVRLHLRRQRAMRGADPRQLEQCECLFDTNTLTIGFARRFASYKRPTLLLTDPARLIRLLNDPMRPVQLFVAGKAHPNDTEGRRMVRQWSEFATRREVEGKAAFLEDYDLAMAAHLVQGVDLWINTPRRPWEACGTSGMKVLVNGGLNLSELDGWWAEAYSTDVGWALGDALEHDADPRWDAVEAEALYRLLEEQVVPAFYARDARGMPVGWIARIRASMSKLTPRFSSNRMMREYVERYYLPAATDYRRRSAGHGENGAALQSWYERLAAGWAQLHFGNVEVVKVGEQHLFVAHVYLGEVDADAVRVELYAEPADGATPEVYVMTRGESLAGAVNGYIYTAAVPAVRPSTDYTPRIVPDHPQARLPLEANLVMWKS